MDSIRCSHIESRRQKEDAGGKHCPDVEANRGRYSAKGFQYGFVARLTGLIKFDRFNGNGAPHIAGSVRCVPHPPCVNGGE
jgi:hypothetical protein